MAVSGRKISDSMSGSAEEFDQNCEPCFSGQKRSDFSGSIYRGSAEDFDHSCDPCFTAGQHVEAHGFCLDCKEYLCKNCFTYHQRTKALKDHQLLDKDSIDKKGIPKRHSMVCTEKCHVHKDQVIKFFCQQHEELGCHDCLSLNHRTCNLEYIPDKCSGIGYTRTSQLLDKKMEEVNAVVKKATEREKEIDTYHEGLVKEIDQFQEEVNNRIQQIRNEIQAEVDKKKSSDKQIVQGVLDTCTKVSTDISKLQSSLLENKTTKQNGQLYIAMKQAMSKLKSDKIKHSECELEKTSKQYRFEPNHDLQKMLSKQKVFGKLLLSVWKIERLTNKEDINIRSKSDKHTCNITGCAVLSSNKLVLADNENNKLKVLDTQTKRVIEKKKLDSSPHDITALPEDQIAVTMPYKEEILIMTSGSKLSTVHTIPIKGPCMGITYHQDHLYVACQNSNNVVVLDIKGNVHNTISLNNDTHVLKNPFYIVVSEDSRLIYISDFDNACIVSITLQGELSAVYKDFTEPQGMLLLGDGSLLVCCYEGTIHQIARDLKQDQKMTGGLQKPQSLCYNHLQHEVYIGGEQCDQLKVLRV